MSSRTDTEAVLNPLLLTYRDATIYASDLELVRSPTGWLNDHCIAFWLQYLKHTILKPYDQQQEQQQQQSKLGNDASTPQLDHLHSDSIEMLDPGAVFMLRFVSTEDLTVATHDNVYLRLTKAELVLFPLNDNTGAESAGRGSNFQPATEIAARAIPLLLSADELEARTDAGIDLIQVPVAQQRNGHDCGVFVLMFAEIISKAFMESVVNGSEERSTKGRKQRGENLSWDLENQKSVVRKLLFEHAKQVALTGDTCARGQRDTLLRVFDELRAEVKENKNKNVE